MRRIFLFGLYLFIFVNIAAASPDTVVVTVKSGETLWDISGRFYKDSFAWKKLLQYNNLRDPNMIKPGQELIVPVNDKKLNKLLQEKWFSETPSARRELPVSSLSKSRAETFTKEIENNLKLTPQLQNRAKQHLAAESEARKETPLLSVQMNIILDVTPPYLKKATIQVYPKLIFGGGEADVRVDCADTLVGLSNNAWAEISSPYDFTTKINLKLRSDSTGIYYSGSTAVPERADNNELFLTKIFLTDKLGNAKLYNMRTLKNDKKLVTSINTSTKYVSNVAVLLTVLIYSLVH